MGQGAAEELEDVINEVTKDRESARKLKFLLFMEDYPMHKVKYDLGVSDCILTFLLSLFLSTLGFIVWGRFTVLGFFAYYATICVIVLETLHIIYDR